MLDYGVQLSLCMVQVAFGVFPALLMGIGRGGWGRQVLRSGSASAECWMAAHTGAALEAEVSLLLSSDIKLSDSDVVQAVCVY